MGSDWPAYVRPGCFIWIQHVNIYVGTASACTYHWPVTTPVFDVAIRTPPFSHPRATLNYFTSLCRLTATTLHTETGRLGFFLLDLRSCNKKKFAQRRSGAESMSHFTLFLVFPAWLKRAAHFQDSAFHSWGLSIISPLLTQLWGTLIMSARPRSMRARKAPTGHEKHSCVAER